MVVTDPTQLAILKVRLAEAELAYHQLALGGQARVIVDQNGERVEFTAGNKGTLAQYIVTLKAQIGPEPLPCQPSAFAPAQFWF